MGHLCTNCRAPQGARGLKYFSALPGVSLARSRPTRGAWIEINSRILRRLSSWRRAPQGARGLKFCDDPIRDRRAETSRPTRGAWIEISSCTRRRLRHRPSRPTRGAWIEISNACQIFCIVWSRPTRGAWIEISWPAPLRSCFRRRAPQGARGLKSHSQAGNPPAAPVAPHKGRVD